jgi:tetratricopeptide (TPR) repeat protein
MAVMESTEQLITLMRNWHKTIKSRNRSKSANLREEVYAALQAGDFKDVAWNGYLLLDARYDLLMGHVVLAEEKLLQLQPDKLFDLQAFFYYCFLALVKFHRKEYLSAVDLFEKAESYMHAVNDEDEHAGLHYNKAMQFYYLDINALSSFHLEKAIAIYVKNPTYKLKVANCKSLQGLNQIDLREFEKAETNLVEALSIAASEGQEDLAVVCQFNLGLMYHKQQADAKGISYLQQAIEYPDHPLYIQALYTLTRSLYILERTEEAESYYRTGIEVCEERNNQEYYWQFAILWSKYIDHNSMNDVYGAAIPYFKEHGLFHLMRTHARDYSQHLWDTQQSDTFAYYHKLSLSNEFQ